MLGVTGGLLVLTGSCRRQDYSVEGWGVLGVSGELLVLTGSCRPQDYSVEGMSESLLTFLQHLREFGLVFQRKVTGGDRGGGRG